MKLFCQGCGKEFEGKGTDKYCSSECRENTRKIRKESLREGVNKICPFCGKEYAPKRSDQIYCSEKCRDKAKWELKKKPLEERICPICKTAFMPTTGKQVCCGPKCGFRKIYLENPEKHKQQSKEWRQKNIERVRENDRRKRQKNKEKYQQIDARSHDKIRFGGNRQFTLEVDDFKCALCGSTENLAVHHRDKSGNTENPNHEITNLITLCSSCHTKVHNPRLETTPHVINTCSICGEQFRVSQARVEDNRGKYCSIECANKAKENKVLMTCQCCGKEFKITPSRAKRGKVKYCSMECRKAAGYAWTGKSKN